MNALKKLLSVFLVACMALSVCAVSFAEGTEAPAPGDGHEGPYRHGPEQVDDRRGRQL